MSGPSYCPRKDRVLWAGNICDVCIICIANFYPFLPNVSLPLSHDIPSPAQPNLLSPPRHTSWDVRSLFTSLISPQFPRSARMAAPNELCRWGPNYGPGSPPATMRGLGGGRKNAEKIMLYLSFSRVFFLRNSTLYWRLTLYIQWMRHLTDYIIAPRPSQTNQWALLLRACG